MHSNSKSSIYNSIVIKGSEKLKWHHQQFRWVITIIIEFFDSEHSWKTPIANSNNKVWWITALGIRYSVLGTILVWNCGIPQKLISTTDLCWVSKNWTFLIKIFLRFNFRFFALFRMLCYLHLTDIVLCFQLNGHNRKPRSSKSGKFVITSNRILLFSFFFSIN